jgi:hypothetical protein
MKVGHFPPATLFGQVKLSRRMPYGFEEVRFKKLHAQAWG